MNKDKMIEWICTHNVGTSSKTMWAGIMGVNTMAEYEYQTLSIPYDCDDFSRCHDLVKFCEVNPAEDFPNILQRYPWYAPIIRNWEELSRLYEAGNYTKVSDILSALRDEAYQIKLIANGNRRKTKKTQ